MITLHDFSGQLLKNSECVDAKRTAFTSAQLHILEMMKYLKSESAVLELQSVIADFYAKKVQKEADRLWEEGVLDAEAIENLGKSHLRTPYVHA